MIAEASQMTNILPEMSGFDFSLERILRGLLGMVVLISIAWIFSTDRKSIAWKTVGTGLLIQMVLAIGILYVPFLQVFFEIIGKVFVKILAFTNEGVTFLLSRSDTGKVDPALQNFAFSILPTIIFFSAISSLLFYFGVIQFFIQGPGPIWSRKSFSGRQYFPWSDRISLIDKSLPVKDESFGDPSGNVRWDGNPGRGRTGCIYWISGGR